MVKVIEALIDQCVRSVGGRKVSNVVQTGSLEWG